MQVLVEKQHDLLEQLAELALEKEAGADVSKLQANIKYQISSLVYAIELLRLGRLIRRNINESWINSPYRRLSQTLRDDGERVLPIL